MLDAFIAVLDLLKVDLHHILVLLTCLWTTRGSAKFLFLVKDFAAVLH